MLVFLVFISFSILRVAPLLRLLRETVVDLVSGSVGGVANVVVGQPMDTVKVLPVLLLLLLLLLQ